MFELTIFAIFFVLVIFLCLNDIGVHLLLNLISVGVGWYFLSEHELMIAAIVLTAAVVMRRLSSTIIGGKLNT